MTDVDGEDASNEERIQDVADGMANRGKPDRIDRSQWGVSGKMPANWDEALLERRREIADGEAKPIEEVLGDHAVRFGSHAVDLHADPLRDYQCEFNDRIKEYVSGRGTMSTPERRSRLVGLLAQLRGAWKPDDFVMCGLEISEECPNHTEKWMTPEQAEIHHHIPRWLVPIHEAWNLEPSCEQCNNAAIGEQRDVLAKYKSWENWFNAKYGDD